MLMFPTSIITISLAEFHGINTAKGSKYAYRRGDYVYYNDYKLNADLDVQYNGISFDLSSNFYGSILWYPFSNVK